jgi:hypothetical protein
MPDGRKRSAAKQARRDARRRKARREGLSAQQTPEDVPLIDEVRQALAGGQPRDLLELVSMVIVATTPKPEVLQRPGDEDVLSLNQLVPAFIDLRVPETTALLAVLGQLVVDDDALRDQCRRAVEVRNDTLPEWLVGLGDTSVHRAVRMTDVFGDGEELLLEIRLADGQEMTGAVFIDHLMLSEVKDAFFVPETIDTVLTIAKANQTDPDTSFVETDLSEAGARLHKALNGPLAMYTVEESDTWPASRALLEWIGRLLPTGGVISEVSQLDSPATLDLLEGFFASLVGMPFGDVDHRQLLEVCIEEGTGDPLRWSAPRLRQLLDGAVGYDQTIPLEVHLDLPELLRAFVPYAHAYSGIRLELTAEALAAIAEVADDYRAEVLEDAQEWADDDGPV